MPKVEGERCAFTCPQNRPPDGWPLEAMRTHPRWKYSLEPGARCELGGGHDGPHRNGGLIWHDPPIVVVV